MDGSSSSSSSSSMAAAMMLAKLSSVKTLPDGNKQYTEKDGTISIVNKNGITIKQIRTDGTIIEINPNAGIEKKKVKKINEDGEEVEEEEEDDDDDDTPKILWVEKQTDPDGTVIEVYKNNIMVQVFKDGSRITQHPGGITHYDASTGDTRHRFLVSF